MTATDDEDMRIAAAALDGVDGLPALRELTVVSVDRSTFDHTYLDFLDEQVQLNARGDEWTARLRERRRALTAWCSRPLITVCAKHGGGEWWIKIDPRSRRIVHLETYSIE